MSSFDSHPKVELHLHLDGALRTATLFDMATTFGISMPHGGIEGFDSLVRASPDCTSLEQFLKPFDVIAPILSHPDTLIRATREVIEDLHAQQVIHAELRFAASLMTGPKRPLEAVVEEALTGLHQGTSQTGMSAGIILCVFRIGSVDEALHTARVAARYRDRGVVGIDLAGPETAPARPYYEAFRLARDAGLGITLHAGEACGPENIREAIDLFSATRIGHGLTLERDLGLMRQVIDQDIAIESCPTSNVHTGQIRSLAEHPFRRYLDAGVAITLSTDDPSLSRITLNGEWENCRRAFGLDAMDFERINENAIRHAFIPASEKVRLAKRLERRP